MRSQLSSRLRLESLGIFHIAGGRRPQFLSVWASSEGCLQHGLQHGVTETENDQEESQCIL